MPKIQILSDGSLEVPDVPIIPYIEGDGVGPDIWKTSVRIFDEAAVFEATHGTAPKYAG
jgi:isocitrate dehydrogenase